MLGFYGAKISLCLTGPLVRNRTFIYRLSADCSSIELQEDLNFFGVPYEDRTHTTKVTTWCAGHYTKDTLKKSNKLAEVTGFEPVITISKTVALDQTKLYPNKG